MNQNHNRLSNQLSLQETRAQQSMVPSRMKSTQSQCLLPVIAVPPSATPTHNGPRQHLIFPTPPEATRLPRTSPQACALKFKSFDPYLLL